MSWTPKVGNPEHRQTEGAWKQNALLHLQGGYMRGTESDGGKPCNEPAVRRWKETEYTVKGYCRKTGLTREWEAAGLINEWWQETQSWQEEGEMTEQLVMWIVLSLCCTVDVHADVVDEGQQIVGPLVCVGGPVVQVTRPVYHCFHLKLSNTQPFFTHSSYKICSAVFSLCLDHLNFNICLQQMLAKSISTEHRQRLQFLIHFKISQ